MSGRSFLAPRATASIPVPRSPNAGRRRDHQLSGGRKSAPDSPDRRCPAAASSCLDRKSTRLNSSHLGISYAVFCLKKKKELNGLIDGVRESTKSWRELHLDLKRRGLARAPELAVADGGLGV